MTAIPARTASGPSAAVPNRRWAALVVIAVAQLMIALDATIVNIALPTAQHALGFGDADRQWVITAYTLSFAGLLLLGGRIADLVGRRRSFLAGLAGFAVASMIAGAAPGFGVLVIGRALQGAFAALLAPTALSLLAVTFTEPRERAKAFGVYGAVASSGAAVGLLLGGALTQYADWRWCLYVNVAIAAAASVAGRIVLPAPPSFPGARVDWISAVLVTGGLAAVVYGAGEAAPHGWDAWRTTAPLAVGGLALALFAVRQARHAAPLLPLRILADRGRAGAYLAVATAVVGAFGVFLTLTYYLQVVAHFSPMRTGLAFLPMAVANSASGYLVGARLTRRVPARLLISAGLLIAAAGLAALTRLDAGSGYATAVVPVEVLLGIGMGAVFPPAFSLATAGVSPREAGVAAAVVNAASQMGGSIGTAVVNTVAIGATAGYLREHGPAASRAGALVHGYTTGATVSALALTAVAVVVMLLIRTPPSSDATTDHTSR